MGGGGFGGGVPSSAALTASIGSRNGRVSSLTAGMIAVCRSSKWLTGLRGRGGRSHFHGLAVVHTVSSLSRRDIAG